MLTKVLELVADIFVPPRASDAQVRTLTQDELHTIQTESGLPYHDARVTALVWEIKYYANKRALALAAAILAPRVVEVAAEEVGVPLLVAVPMHRARKKERGHNQTDVLCHALSRLVSLEYMPHALERIVNTPQQQGLERHIRLYNVKNSMYAQSHVKDRVCIVVDDVTTTGATLEEAKRALTKAGARAVYTLALAYS